jgi:hypothetical protein
MTAMCLCEVTPNKLVDEYYVAPNPHESWHVGESPTQLDSFEIEPQRLWK